MGDLPPIHMRAGSIKPCPCQPLNIKVADFCACDAHSHVYFPLILLNSAGWLNSFSPARANTETSPCLCFQFPASVPLGGGLPGKESTPRKKSRQLSWCCWVDHDSEAPQVSCLHSRDKFLCPDLNHAGRARSISFPAQKATPSCHRPYGMPLPFPLLPSPTGLIFQAGLETFEVL